MVDGFVAPAWLASESFPVLLPLEPSEQLGMAGVQLLTDLLWAHPTTHHPHSVDAEDDVVLCRNTSSDANRRR